MENDNKMGNDDLLLLIYLAERLGNDIDWIKDRLMNLIKNSNFVLEKKIGSDPPYEQYSDAKGGLKTSVEFFKREYEIWKENIEKLYIFDREEDKNG